MKRKRMILMLAALVMSATMIGYAVAQEGERRGGGERAGERRGVGQERRRPSGSERGGERRRGPVSGMGERGGARPRHRPVDPSSEVHRKLRKIIQKLNIERVGLKKALQTLSDTNKINIHVKWAALEQVGVTKDSKVDVHLTNVTLDKALRTILEDVGGVVSLAFVVDEGVITISTRDNLQATRNRAMQDRVMAAERAFPRKRAERMEQMIGLVQRMKHVCFDSETVGVMAVGALKDEIPRKDEDIIKDLEELLGAGKNRVRELGLRNAIRLTLKDIYKRQGNNEKVIEHIKALIAENDKALQAEEKK